MHLDGCFLTLENSLKNMQLNKRSATEEFLLIIVNERWRSMLVLALRPDHLEPASHPKAGGSDVLN